MVAAFEAELKGKSKEINSKMFVNVLARLRETIPELVSFDDNVAGIVFQYCGAMCLLTVSLMPDSHGV